MVSGPGMSLPTVYLGSKCALKERQRAPRGHFPRSMRAGSAQDPRRICYGSAEDLRLFGVIRGVCEAFALGF